MIGILLLSRIRYLYSSLESVCVAHKQDLMMLKNSFSWNGAEVEIMVK